MHTRPVFLPSLILLHLFASAPLPGAEKAAPPAAPPSLSDRLKQFHERFPEADADKDGKLTMEEVRAFNRKRRAAEARPGGDRERPGAATLPPTHADVPYGDHPKQRFDLWLPPGEQTKPVPLVIYIHGGGFRGGDKRVSASVPKPYLDAGVAFASMNYRLTDVGPYPMQMHDAARGLQTIRARSEEWDIDGAKIACYGGSAGAGISLWLAFHDDLADPGSDDPIAVQSTRIVAAGTSNGQSTYDHHTFREWFGVPELEPHPALFPLYAIGSSKEMEREEIRKLMADASPITHLTKDDPPVYMTYGRGNVPVDKNTDAGTWVHHVLLGLKLQEAMEPLGIPCHVQSPDHPEKKYGSLPAFLIEQVKK